MEDQIDDSFDGFEDDGIESDVDDGVVEEELDVRPKKDDYSDKSVASATIANPKRQHVVKRQNNEIARIISISDLDKSDGQLLAWTKLSDAIDTEHPKTYRLDAILSEVDVLQHPTFGIGFILEILSPTKASVLFESGLKKLVCKTEI